MSTPSEPVIVLADGRSIGASDLRRRVEDVGVRSIGEVRFLESMIIERLLPLESIQSFVDRARTSGMGISQFAAASQIAADDDLARALGRAHQLPTVNLEQESIDDAMARALVASTAHMIGAIPIRRDPDGVVLVAVSNPDVPRLGEELLAALGSPPRLVVAPAGQVRAAITRAHTQGEAVITDNLVEGLLGEDTGVEEDIRTGAVADNEVVRIVNMLIERAVNENASDIHIEPYPNETLVRMRVDGVLVDLDRIPSRLHQNVVSRVKILGSLRIEETRESQDGRTTVQVGSERIDIRIATLPSVYGETITLRLLNLQGGKLNLEDLGLHPNNLDLIRRAIRRPYGSIVIAGPTGSGKSTTLYGILDELNETTRKVITVEDPVERRIHGITQIHVNPRQKMTFANALRAILRSDPDVMMIGEVRDEETARITMESALTGHLVLTSIHTNNAAATITRLEEMDIEQYLIAGSIEMIVAQRLVRKLCTSCRTPFQADGDYMRAIGAPEHVIERAAANPLTIYEAAGGGCGNCSGRGYRGRVGVHEVLDMTPELKLAVTRGSSETELEEMARRNGMLTLHDDCLIKVLGGITSVAELAKVVA